MNQHSSLLGKIYSAGHFLALALLLLTFLIAAPGAAQQPSNAAIIVSVEANVLSEPQNNPDLPSIQLQENSAFAKNAPVPHKANMPINARLERMKREFAHQLELVKKDVMSINTAFAGIDRDLQIMMIILGGVALIMTIAGIAAASISAYWSFKAQQRATSSAEQKVQEFLARKEPEIDKRVGEIGREAAQGAIKWAQENKHAEEKTKKPDGKISDSADNPTLEMHVAALTGDVNKIKQFIRDGGSVNEQDKDGDTPLTTAMFGNNPGVVVKELIAYGANVNAKNFHGLAPLHLAAVRNVAIAIPLLKDEGADIDVRDNADHTPLHLAAFLGSYEASKTLIEHGASVHAEDNTKATPIHAAAAQSTDAIISLLLEKGADINARDKDGDSPLLIAEFGKSYSTAKMLVDRGANVKVANKKGYTPLHVAVAQDMDSVIPLLLEKGADINAQDEDGDTPLDVAVELGRYAIADNLQKRGGKHKKDI